MSRDNPPVRDPDTPGYVEATKLLDGEVPPVDTDGNFVVGPTHSVAPEMSEPEGGLRGTVHKLLMESSDSKIYPGIAREEGTRGTPDPDNPAKLIVTTSYPASYSRKVRVYVPEQYVSDTEADLMISTDGPDYGLFTALDNLIAEGRVPPIVAVSISSGGGDAQGSQRGLEYDTMSGLYAEFVETEVLPLVEAECNVRLTRNPDRRATMGYSSGAACAMSMAWYRNDLFRRILSFSGTFVNQQWPYNPDLPGGAWEYHNSILLNEPVKPLRIWLAVADQDFYNPNAMRDDMHDWVLANERMARVLADRGYSYQFSFVQNAKHVDRAMVAQLLPQALEYLWQ